MEKNENKASLVENVYEGTSSSLQKLVSEYTQYASLLSAFKQGEAKMELRKRFFLRVLDEKWINAVEDALPSIDTVMRHPSESLIEYEEVLPIERTKKVTSQSVVHLSQHTDLINEIREDGMVMPAKLLNRGQEDTMLTYENRFLNTLVLRLYSFVMSRYDAANECGLDEKNVKFTYDQSFEEGERKAEVHLTFEFSEPPQNYEQLEKNYVYTDTLWKRLERIVATVKSLMASPFVHAMGKNYIRPPVMRTNKLQKHVDFHNCLILWEFLETYENTGYDTLVKENLEEMDAESAKEMTESTIAQYILFKKHTNAEFDDENALDSRLSDVFTPKFKDELDEFDQKEYDYEPPKEEEIEDELNSPDAADKIEEAIKIALLADQYYVAETEEPEEAVMEKGQILYRYRYSFLARLIFAQDPTQTFYTILKNYILSYTGVKSHISWNHELFTYKKNKCVKFNVRGKTLFVYLPLNPEDYKYSKYHFEDLRDPENPDKEIPFPFLIKVRSMRATKYAMELIDKVMDEYFLTRDRNYKEVDYHMPYADAEELADREPPLVKRLFEPVHKVEPTVEPQELTYVTYLYSFRSHVLLAEHDIQARYSELKNYILSYSDMKCRTAWSHESYYIGRHSLVMLKMRGKTLTMFIRLPEDSGYENYMLEDLDEDYDGYNASIKIKTNRALQRAEEMIDDAMEYLEIEQKAIPNDNYVDEPHTVEELLSMDPPLIKEKYSKKKPFWVKETKDNEQEQPNAETSEPDEDIEEIDQDEDE